MPARLDAVVIGSGPNGLAAAVELARNGASVLVLEAAATIGGGTRTAELTLPGYHHDVCSAAHPLGILSPYLSTLPLAEHGLTWIQPPASVAHPLDREPAVILRKSIDATAASLGPDAAAYRRLIGPLLRNPHELIAEILGPAHLPRHPLLLARFGVPALLPATVLGHRWFRGDRARALFAGCAAHSILPLTPAGQRRRRHPLPDHRPRRDMADRTGRIRIDHRRPRRIPALPRRPDRDRAAGARTRRPACLAHRALRHQPRPGRNHRIAGAPRQLRSPPAPLPLRTGHLQDRLGAGRPDPLDRPGVPRGGDGSRGRHPRRDRGRRRPPSGAASTPTVPSRSSSSRASSTLRGPPPASTPAGRTATSPPGPRSTAPT